MYPEGPATEDVSAFRSALRLSKVISFTSHLRGISLLYKETPCIFQACRLPFFEVSRLHVHISSHWDGSSSYQPLTIRDDDLSTFNEKTNLFRVHEWHEVDTSSPYVPFSLFPYGVPNIRSCRGKRPEVSSTWGHRDPKDQRNKNVQTLSGYD